MEDITNLFKTHSLNVVLLGWLIIVFIGILKYFKLFSKIKSADMRKFIYIALNVALSFGFGALYVVLFGLEFATAYLPLVIELVPVVLVEYAIYENIGLRKLLQILGNYIVNVVANNKVKAEAEKIKNNTNKQKNA